MTPAERLRAALERFDALNARDPERVVGDGVDQPRQLLAADRLERWVLRLAPEPSLALRLAARCQHLERWVLARTDYPPGRLGYLKWRKDLSHHHAERAAEVLRELAFDEGTIAAVRAINLKLGLKTDPDTQTMEDALCLSFLEHEFADFAAKHDEAKVIDIVQKTWRKMSARGQAEALKLALPPALGGLVERALSGAGDPSADGGAA